MSKVYAEQLANKNQLVLFIERDIIFQSYDSTIAFIDAYGNVTLGLHWDYSKTTRKHLYMFLRKYSKFVLINSKKEVEQLIKSGEIKYQPDLD